MNPIRHTRRADAFRAIERFYFGVAAALGCFFTRILPLNDWSSTEDEPELDVPEKELPALEG